MSSFLGWLRKIGEIQVIPPIPGPALREHAPRLLSAADQRRVLDAIPEHKRGIFLALRFSGYVRARRFGRVWPTTCPATPVG